MILPLVHHTDPVLHQKLEPVTEFNLSLRQTARDMIDTMNINEGVGLAANQVGINKRMFTLATHVAEGYMYGLTKTGMCFINPELHSVSDIYTTENEGCLSYKHKTNVPKRRYAGVVITAQDMYGQLYRYNFHGLLAAAVMHELDHLNGITIHD